MSESRLATARRGSPLVTDPASRPRRGTRALGCTPHRTLVEQPYSADAQQRRYVLALAQTGPTRRAPSRTAWRPTHLGRLRPVPAHRERQHVFSLFMLLNGRQDGCLGREPQGPSAGRSQAALHPGACAQHAPGAERAAAAPTRCATLPFALEGAPSPAARCMLDVRRRWALQSF